MPTKSIIHCHRWLMLSLIAIVCLATLGRSLPVAAQGQQIRLGDLRVDWYCLQRGYSAWIVNNGANWACTASNGAIVSVLTQPELNSACQGFYRNPAAYAVRDRASTAPALTTPPAWAVSSSLAGRP